jgi:hypothetical protein
MQSFCCRYWQKERIPRGCQDFRSFRPTALGRTQNSFERKEEFGFVHWQLSMVEEPPKVGRERKWPILAVAHRAKIGHTLLRWGW